MHLIKIDDVGLQAPQRVFHLLYNPCLAGVAKRRGVAPVQADLRRDCDAGAAIVLRQGLAKNFFGAPKAIDGRRIE